MFEGLCLLQTHFVRLSHQFATNTCKLYVNESKLTFSVYFFSPKIMYKVNLENQTSIHAIKNITNHCGEKKPHQGLPLCKKIGTVHYFKRGESSSCRQQYVLQPRLQTTPKIKQKKIGNSGVKYSGGKQS